MRNSGEPTVEEILDSIKKVIARDNRASAAEQRRQRESDGMIEAGFAEVEDEAEDVLDLTVAAPFSGEDDGAVEIDNADAPMITAAARSSMQDSLAALAVLAEPGVQPQIVRSGETSLEGLTRELLRPALAQWLETNLPPLVERLVAAEIARIVGKKG